MKETISKLLLPLLLRVLRRAPRPRVQDKAGILIFKPDRIGDFVLAAECIRRIRDKFSPQRCAVVISGPMLSLAQRELSDVSFLPLPPAEGSFFLSLFKAWQWGRKHLGGIRWDTLVNLRYHLTLREDLVLSSVRANESYGVARGLNANSWPDRLAAFRPAYEIAYPRGRNGQPSELVAHEMLLHSIGCGSAAYRPRLASWSSEQSDYLLLSPFGSESIRSYPTDRLVEAFSRADLPKDLHIKICVERSCLDEARLLADKLSLQGFFQCEVVTAADIAAFIDCVASAKAVVAMESAAAHIAIALRKPGVFIVGGGHYGAFAPWSTNSNQHWVTNRLPCFGCDWDCIRTKPECISDIDATEVGSKIASSLKSVST